MSLDYITIKGFKSIADVDRLKLRPLNVLIGPNGSGKSNFIGAFSFLHEVRAGRLQNYVRNAGGPDELLYFGVKTTPEMRFALSFGQEKHKYELVLQYAAGYDSLVPAEEATFFWDKPRYPERPFRHGLLPVEGGREAGISASGLGATPLRVQRHLDRWRLYHLHDTSESAPMRRTAQLDDNRYLRPDGGNLPAFLFLLKQRHLDSYEVIRDTVSMVAPFFADFQLEPDRINPSTIRLAWRHRDSEKYFGASALSDGTLRFMVLATLFLQPKILRPSTIIVDEPELGLHPYAIGLLASLARQASRQTQVLISTQSPLLLDHLEPEDVLVTEQHEGASRFTRLETERLVSWLEHYSLGQLWEKNELGARPSAG
jgi:predicted ATPase